MSTDPIMDKKLDWRELERMSIAIKLEPVIGYARAVEKILPEYRKEIDKEYSSLEEKIATKSEEHHDMLREEYFIEIYELENVFPQVLRYTLFVYTYSRFEKILLGIADDYRRRRKLEIKPSDLKDTGIWRARTYLKKVLSIPFPAHEESWQDIVTLGVIRNQVVHNDGELPEGPEKIGDKRKIQSLMKKNKWKNDISIDDDGKFEFSQGFIPLVIGTFRTFLDKLVDVLPDE